MPKFPPSLAKLLDKVESHLPELIRFGRGNNREMRKDCQRSISAILVYLLKKMDISSGRCVSRVSPDTYCTITVAKIAEDVGLSKRTVNRVLTLLAYFKLLEVTPQKKRHVADCLLVTAAIRKITDKFFALYGLLEALKSDRKYQEIHGKPIHIKVCVAKIFLADRRHFSRSDQFLLLQEE